MWQPDVTVAAICERDGRFLMVEEYSKSSGLLVLNQPAGHMEDNETLIEAVVRETLEETCCHFQPEALVGHYRLRADNGKTYLRYTFCGSVSKPDAGHTLDPDILQTKWMTREELEQAGNLRSNLVLACIKDYQQGQRFPLDLLCEV